MTWAISVPILVFLGPSVLDLGLMYMTHRRQTSSLNAPPIRGEGIIILIVGGTVKHKMLCDAVNKSRTQGDATSSMMYETNR